MKELTQETAAKAAAEMLKVIHSGAARRVLPKLTKAQLGEVVETAEKEIALKKSKFVSAKQAMKALQYGGGKHVATTQVDSDVLEKMADGDPAKAIAKLHQNPQRCALPQLGSRANHAALRKRLEKESE